VLRVAVLHFHLHDFSLSARCRFPFGVAVGFRRFVLYLQANVRGWPYRFPGS
jgi:hypothetical protein